MISNLLRSVFKSWAGRLVLLCVVFGYVPFWLLSKACDALGR